MEKKVKLGMGALWCVSFIFAMMGLGFLLVGSGLLFAPQDEEARTLSLWGRRF